MGGRTFWLSMVSIWPEHDSLSVAWNTPIWNDLLGGYELGSRLVSCMSIMRQRTEGRKKILQTKSLVSSTDKAIYLFYKFCFLWRDHGYLLSAGGSLSTHQDKAVGDGPLDPNILETTKRTSLLEILSIGSLFWNQAVAAEDKPKTCEGVLLPASTEAMQ